jgi:hypothetical protein
MNRLNTDARLPQDGDKAALLRRLAELQREVATLVNAIAEGRMAGAVNAMASPPADPGPYAPGDFVRNSAPLEQGAAGNKYVLAGWVRLPTGFVEQRFLTGN